ncbi:Ankyrin repeat family protein [Prunus dulcis]|uniref:Ankyrin repeat family protein n=1 Tax=Prunus dulcis TaxID=3755 RepID=A0A4Y1RS46_PRUDU|nr:Ankyrin repeat family protein [Prunus dulcis]
MSRRWIQNPNRCSDEYLDGIEDFIEFARRHNPGATRIRCPCRRCNNTLWETIENVGFHLVRNGMIETYSIWNLHGEQLDHASSSNATRMDSVEPIVDPNDQVMDIIEDVFPFASTNINHEREDDVPTPIDSAEFEQYEKLLKNANQELYPGCESFSVLTAIVELMHGKIKYRMSNLCFDYFLGVFKRMLPTDNCLPKDHKHAQKEHETLDTCLICNESRFKMTSQNRTTKIPQKVMRYLPLKPRLQRLYMSTHTATDMRWHKEKRVDDDVMRHPADGEAWKEFDRTFPEFAADPRNVRLGLATDGFNPYGVLNQHHSTWPIFVFPYNLPPWKCMKKEYMMMTVLITEDPGRSIDVYLRPLVDELKDLWTNGVRTYDKSTGKMFTLRAAVMWTVNDFPAYAMVSGWSTKGYMACPVCKEDVTSGWHAGKVCYLGHRRWLPWDHEWREKDKEFDGNTERRLRPREWSGDEILEQLNRLDFAPFGKTVSRTRPSTHMNWTHKPMLFELPYWSKLKLRHNLDVMHVEKNVFDTLVGTILDIEGKTKDTIKARLDLERMGIRRGLWMNRDSDKARRDLAFFSMKPNDKKEFLKFVSSKVCVNVDGGKFTGLKSHDCHVFMQRLLPVGIRHLLPEDVVKPIMLLSRFFSQLTAKTLRKTDILQLRHDIVQVLCKFEMIFPPAFFTSMMHVMVHLPEEALLAGPVNYRWMYPIERLLGELKKSVRNRAKPEGSIIEAWVQYESLTFCGMYLKMWRRLSIVLSVITTERTALWRSWTRESFSRNDMEVAHWFVLNNCDEIMAYLDEHEEMMKREHPSHLVAQKQRELFPQWFLESVNKLKSSNSPTYSDELYNLAFGRFALNCFRVVILTALNFWGLHEMTSCVRKTAVSMSQVEAKCRWFDSNPNRPGSVKIDHGLLSVNINRTWYDDDPYILANMATQIVYLDDPKAGSSWKVVQKMDHRNVYAIPELDLTDNDVDNVADQRLESSMENDAETLRDTHVIQEPFQIQGVSSIEIPIQSITIDLGIFQDSMLQWARAAKMM